MDTAAYVALATSAGPHAYFVSPLYIYFLRAFDVSLVAVRIAQIILGSVAVVLIFDTSRRWFGDRAATIGAVLAILTGVISFYEVTVLQAAIDPFLVALTLSLLTYALQTGDQVLFAVTGLSLGAFVLNRPNAILWAPVVVLAVIWVRSWRNAAALTIAFLLPLGAVTLRNYVVAHEVVLIASHGGLNFYIGNSADADGTYHHVPGIRPTIAGQEEDAPVVEAREGSFYRRAWTWIAGNPGMAAILFLRKIAYTFNQTDLALNYSYAYFEKDVQSPLRWLVVGPWLLFPLGIAGAFRNLRNRAFAAWFTFVPVYAVSVAIFFVSSRYRLPLLVPMCIASGALFVRPHLGGWVAAAVLAVAVCWNFGLDDGRAHERTNMIVYLIEAHRFDEADQLIAATDAMTRDPQTLHARSAEAYRSIAVASVQSGQPDDALRAFRAAQGLEPANASDLLNMAVLEAQHGQIAEARRHAQEALLLHPGYVQAEGLLQALEGR